jgi:pyroglutamyl-peptidase
VFRGIYEQGAMTTKILITGFGPFPGAPFNPTEPLVMALARPRHPFGNVRRVTHIFRVSYEAVDRELPTLLAREQPDVLLMFGLASRTKHVRIETRARNALAPTLPDVGGHLPVTATIAPDAPATRPLRNPEQRLVMAARAAGVPAVVSRDAGRYLCNYLCWRAAEATGNGGPQLTAFIHVPLVRRGRVFQPRRQAVTLDDLIRAGEAIVQAALAAARR